MFYKIVNSKEAFCLMAFWFLQIQKPPNYNVIDLSANLTKPSYRATNFYKTANSKQAFCPIAFWLFEKTGSSQQMILET